MYDLKGLVAICLGFHILLYDISPAPTTNVCRYCSRATGFIQPVQDEVMQGFVAGLRRGLHATYPAPGAHGSALASAPGRHSFASCESAGCSAPPHWMLMAAACRQETSRPFPRWANRAS